MFCKLISYTLIGIKAQLVSVEIDISDGLPSFDIVGLPDSSVRESKERVKSALRNSGFSFPIKRITINLAPADVRKEGSLYDLPIALGILCASGYIPKEKIEKLFSAGELSLDGHLRKTRGLIPILCTLQDNHSLPSLVPSENYEELRHLNNSQILYCHHLKDAIAFICDGTLPSFTPPTSIDETPQTFLDFADVKGQESIKRGMMVAAAGFHNILLIGPPGSGKTMLAKRLPYIMPPLSNEEKIEITKIYSITNKLLSPIGDKERPFRSPHHTITVQGLTGGGINPKPGELSLAHLGVLFLDELLEFNKKTLEVLRQPLEDGVITLSRVNQNITYPSQFLMAASCNPCPCGYYPDPKRCTCDFVSVRRYLSKLSGPLLDRISIQLELQPVSFESLHETENLSSSTMSSLIQSAFAIQQKRFKDDTIRYNSQIPAHQLSKYCILTDEAYTLLTDWFARAGASARGHAHILRLSRTIADLNGSTLIDVASIAEAIQYRLLDRQFFS